ncbi:TPA: hypothetical protein ACJ51G_000958 [Aeromonas hydrophila subsp. hydrophila]|uniref:DotH/IcmK family type IV secretion protein n=1 Tax=Aeromonas caviae TaxID=648 RepID=UPI000FEBF720|nr:DotH/IcmK family type IV secretion protein [Aeromonas caviae]RWT75352.1 hypothetical protein DN604_12185 [Aeromonas caviae]
MINKRAFALLVLSQIVCGSSALANGTEQQNAADKSEPSEQRELTNVPRLPPEINQKMYGEGVGTIEQLNSDEYRDIYERSTETAKTMDSLSAGQYKQRNTSEPFDERPGAPTKELTLAKGLDTNVVFVDAMGEPWPIQKADVSNGAYSVSLTGEHIVKLTVKRTFVTANLTVLLVDKTMPMTFRLSHAEKLTGTVDVTKVYRVPGISPMSEKKPAQLKGEPIPDMRLDLNPFLDDLPPREAIEVQVNGPSDVKVWTYRGKLVVRTKKELITPVGLPVYGVSGWRIYEVENPMPVLVLLDEGEQHYAYIPEDSIADLANGGAK